MTKSPPTSRLPAATDSSWRLQLILLFSLTALTTAVFWFSDLDLRVASYFYHPQTPDDLWPTEALALWQFFYYGAPVLTTILAVGALLAMLFGLLRGQVQSWRRPAALFLLTLVLGPGLLVNLLFKENWGRPRPRQVEQFQGDMQFIPPLKMAETKDGKSFMSGHASVGYTLFAFWFVWRRRRPQLAWGFFTAATLLGLTIGMGRMAGGAHFLSDVLWAGFVTYFAALLSHYFLLPESKVRQPNGAERISPLALTGYTAMGVFVLTGSLMLLPVKEDIDFRLDANGIKQASHLVLDIDQARVDIHLLPPAADPTLWLQGNIRGFGLPTYEIRSLGQGVKASAPTYRYSLEQNGFFTELDTRLRVQISTAGIQQLRVNLQQGDINVTREPNAVAPKLELHTDQGDVSLPKPRK